MTLRGSLDTPGPAVEERRGSPALRLPIAVGLAGLLLTAAVFYTLWNDAGHEAEQRLATQVEAVSHSMSVALDTVHAKLISLSGLFRASEIVTPAEFRLFTNDVGLESGMAGIGYVIEVDAADFAAMEAVLQTQTGSPVRVFEMDGAGAPVELGSRPQYYLVQHVSPQAEWGPLMGFDLGSFPVIASELSSAMATGQVAMTSFLQLPGQDDSDTLVMLRAVTEPSTDEPVALVVALLDFSQLLEARIPAGVRPYVDWDVAELTSEAMDIPGNAAQLGFGDRTWVITVTATPDSPFGAARGGAYIVLALGLLTTVLAALLVFLVRQRIESAATLAAAHQTTDAKVRFIAAVSHELRTPLTAVLGFAEILRDGEELSDLERVAMMKAITEEATDLAHIIDDLLVAARGEIGQVVVTRASISMRDAVHAVVQGSGLADRITVVPGDGGPDIAVGDPNRARQILRNLVENARRYGGTHIEIEILDQGEWLYLEVRDDGSGVPASILDRLFEPYQHSGSDVGLTESLGLGLSVSSQLADLMGGELTHQQRDGWTVFTLTLPTARIEGADLDKVPFGVGPGSSR
ncbi:MAG TPA: ATP-binding protein [Acidimicrobiia bacterium]